MSYNDHACSCMVLDSYTLTPSLPRPHHHSWRPAHSSLLSEAAAPEALCRLTCMSACNEQRVDKNAGSIWWPLPLRVSLRQSRFGIHCFAGLRRRRNNRLLFGRCPRCWGCRTGSGTWCAVKVLCLPFVEIWSHSLFSHISLQTLGNLGHLGGRF